MTCYLRHLTSVFQKAGIVVTPQNKAEIDKVIHKIAGTDYKNCPETWKHVKNMLAKDEASFILKLKEEMQHKHDH